MSRIILVLLRLGRGRDLDGTHDIDTGGRDGEHAKVVLERSILSSDGSGGYAILKGVHLISVFVGRTHGRLDAAVGQKSTQHDVLNAVLTQQEVEIGGLETAESRFSLDDEIALLRLHCGVELCAPFTIRKGSAFLHPSEDSVGGFGDFVVSLKARDYWGQLVTHKKDEPFQSTKFPKMLLPVRN